jgi:hypothetical protein
MGSPWKRSKRDRDIIAIAGEHPAMGVPEAGIPPLPRLRLKTITSRHHGGTKDTE